MANKARNLSRPGVFAKLSTVTRWVDQCVCEWVIEHRSFRELSSAERLSRMAANIERSGSVIDNRPDSRRESYLPPVNGCGVIERMPNSDVWMRDRKFECLIAAREQKWLAQI